MVFRISSVIFYYSAILLDVCDLLTPVFGALTVPFGDILTDAACIMRRHEMALLPKLI